MWCRGLAGCPPPSAATVAQTRRARAATVALDTGKARLCTLSAVTSAARTLPPGSTASKLTDYLTILYTYAHSTLPSAQVLPSDPL
jgi:hypothetical protein